MPKEEFWPTNRGFETSYGHMTGGIGYFDHTAAGRLDWHRNESTLREEGYSTELIANEAINIIKNKDQSRPLFLYVAFNAPHTPIQAQTHRHGERYRHARLGEVHRPEMQKNRRIEAG